MMCAAVVPVSAALQCWGRSAALLVGAEHGSITQPQQSPVRRRLAAKLSVNHISEAHLRTSFW